MVSLSFTFVGAQFNDGLPTIPISSKSSEGALETEVINSTGKCIFGTGIMY